MMNNIKKNVNGILLLDKPLGISSNAALQKVKRLFNAKKAGHTGSLDPLATGMLPICFGQATKFSEYLLESNKFYQVTAKLGIKTTTGDAEGSVVETRKVTPFSATDLSLILQSFTGIIQQIPPMYSAIKYKGKPLYSFARKGIEISRAARNVKIFSLNYINLDGENLTLQVHCSKGTYVRTLIEDIGERLGCGAHIIDLRRMWVGTYQNDKMQTFDELLKLNFEDLESTLLPIESSIKVFPIIKLSTSSAYYVKLGQSIRSPNLEVKVGLVRLYSEDNVFIGVGEIDDNNKIILKRLVA